MLELLRFLEKLKAAFQECNPAHKSVRISTAI